MFRVMQGGRLSGKAYLVAHIYIFCPNFVGLFDGMLMLGIYCMTVSRSCKEKRVLPHPRHKRLQHNLCKRRLGTIILRLQSDLQSRYFF